MRSGALWWMDGLLARTQKVVPSHHYSLGFYWCSSLLKLVVGDLAGKGQPFQISVADFSKCILPRLTDHDCVICIQSSLMCAGLSDTMKRFIDTQ